MKTVLAYLQIMRFPLVFTVGGDILLGYLLAHGSLESATPFVYLLASSVCLYLSGMVLNDFFDVEQDREERPTRPIPSGTVSLSTAKWLGFGLMMSGVALSIGGGVNAVGVAVLLAACILTYNRWAKRDPSGPFFMGMCRSLNIVLGASGCLYPWTGTWMMPLLAGLMGLYIMGVTTFAKSEANDSDRKLLIRGTCQVYASLMIIMTVMVTRANPVAMIVVAVAAMAINRKVVVAIRTPTPKNVMPAVGIMLQWYIFLLAALISMITPNEPMYAVAIAALFVPIFLLKRVIPLT